MEERNREVFRLCFLICHNFHMAIRDRYNLILEGQIPNFLIFFLGIASYNKNSCNFDLKQTNESRNYAELSFIGKSQMIALAA